MIEHLKSGLSVSTHVGCSMACSYCVLSSMNGFHNGSQQDESPSELVERLLSGCELFLNGKTPLIINNRTDPMLPAVAPFTYELLRRLADAGITSPILIISKFAPTEELTTFLNQLHIMYIYSYSGLLSDFNYISLEKTVMYDMS